MPRLCPKAAAWMRMHRRAAMARDDAAAPRRAGATRGLLRGLLGGVGFSRSWPAARAAAPELGGGAGGLGRAVLAGVRAAGLLLALGEPWPARRLWPGLAIVALGVVGGFPVLTAIALRAVPSAHW